MFALLPSLKDFLVSLAIASVINPAIKNLMPANKVFAPASSPEISKKLNPSLISGKAKAHVNADNVANKITNGFI